MELVQPHCHITVRCTKEIAGFNELGEAVKRLDLGWAGRDVRRFNYICAVLELLLGERMCALSGTAQRALLASLEQLAQHAAREQLDPRRMRRLAAAARAAAQHAARSCWGAAHGSTRMWSGHAAALERIAAIAAAQVICISNC